MIDWLLIDRLLGCRALISNERVCNLPFRSTLNDSPISSGTPFNSSIAGVVTGPALGNGTPISLVVASAN